MKKDQDSAKTSSIFPATDPHPFVNNWGPETRHDKQPSTARNAFSLEYPLYRQQLIGQVPKQFDQSQIPVEIDAETGTASYHADDIVKYGLHQIICFIENGDIPARYQALHIAEWLINHLSEWRKHIFAWPSEKPQPFYKLSAPRVSAKTHGLALSLLLRVAYIENDAWYEETIKKIVRLFFLPVEEGGLVRQLGSGSLAFEEFPTPDQTVPLSSHLYSLIGLSEYANYFDDNDVKTILRGGLRGLRELMPVYDNGKWLLFDLHASKRCASLQGIRNVCVLLKILSNHTEDKQYAEMAQKWYAYTNTFANKRFYLLQRIWEAIRLRFSAKKLHIDAKYLKVAPR